MSSDEQRVRTMAGWIGVEISRSRVRTPGKAGYGLYRVRGWELPRFPTRVGQNAMDPVLTEWTAYAFTLDEIELAVLSSIERGRPDRPGQLAVRSAATGDQLGIGVPTRWTSAYRGKRNLGERTEMMEVAVRRSVYWESGKPVALRPESAAEVDALVVLLDAGLAEMVHVEGCVCDVAGQRFTAACVDATMTPRQRQRVANGEFQREHLERRAYGLEARYRAKAARNTITDNTD